MVIVTLSDIFTHWRWLAFDIKRFVTTSTVTMGGAFVIYGSQALIIKVVITDNV